VSERLTIAHLAHRGDGVADTPGGPVYVAYALPGETVEVERVPGRPDRRHLLRVVEASAERIEPICQHFGVCGGCAIQHWTPERYRSWKHGLVVAALAQAGLDAPVEALIDAHGQGRRRVTLHARSSHAPSTTRNIGTKRRRAGGEFLEVGFATLRAHTLAGIDHCPVLAPSLDGAINAAWAIAEALEPMGKPLDIQATATESGLDVDVRGSGLLDAAHSLHLANVAQAHRLARLTRHGELIAQRTAPTITIGRAKVTLPPGGFLQATAAGEMALAELVLAATDGAKHVADLFCGVGPFALRLAERARVAAFDQDAEATAALRQAARGTTGLKPVEAAARDLFRRPLVAQELARFDAVVFDPPRQGAQAQAAELAKSKLLLVIAVSCNPATFARDARLLADGGYRLMQVTPVDQFRYSPHVEIVAKFER
jgi:23S rRNA (uracil1939-C5)-methyltransferase